MIGYQGILCCTVFAVCLILTSADYPFMTRSRSLCSARTPCRWTICPYSVTVGEGATRNPRCLTEANDRCICKPTDVCALNPKPLMTAVTGYVTYAHHCRDPRRIPGSFSVVTDF